MRTLLCVRSPIYPPKGGSPLRNWQNVCALADLGEVAVFSVFPGPVLSAPVTPPIRWEHFDSKLGEGITIPEAAIRAIHPYHYPVADQMYFSGAVEHLRQLMADFQPDVVIFGELWLYHYASIVREFPCKIILDNHNVEYLGTTYQDKVPQGSGLIHRLNTLIRPWQVKCIERHFCQLADQIWVCSSKDLTALQMLYKISVDKICLVPNTINVLPFQDLHCADTAPPIPVSLHPLDSYLLFPATFGYAANDQAAIDLIHDIYPRLCKKLPHKFKLLFVGRSPNYAMLEAAKANPDIIVIGEVEDIKPYYAAASIVIVPLRFGSGTRLKILEAFAAKKPVVSTPKGAEGLLVQTDQHLVIGEDASGLVDAIVRLVQEPNLAEYLTHSAWELVQKFYSWPVAQKAIYQALERLAGLAEPS